MASQIPQIAEFEGTWTNDRNDNLDDFLKASGMNYVKRKMANNIKPTCVIKVEADGKITIKTKGGPIEIVNTFTLDEEFETENRGEKGKVIGTFEDGKLCVNPSPNNTNPTIPNTTREIINGEMCWTLQLGDVVTMRYFKKAAV